METVLSGGCACGAVRYDSSASAKFSMICQCRQCQRISGSGHAAQFVLDAEAVTIEGEVTFYEFTSDSGNTSSSGFCGKCGSPVVRKTSGYPKILMFHAATLDDPARFKPERVVYADAAQPWDHVDPDLPRG